MNGRVYDFHLKGLIIFGVLILSSTPTFAANPPKEDVELSTPAFQFGLQAIDKSAAYQDFLKHPVSERSKIVYLIERFKDSKVEIDYGGHYYKPNDIACLVQMFIASHFDQNETAEQWVMKYGNRTIPTGKPIWIRSNGRFYQSRNILMQELNGLEKVLSRNIQLNSAQH